MKTIKNPRIELWAHLVSEHAVCLNFNWTMKEYEDHHDYEHKGPGTIRNHPKNSRVYSFKKIGEVLAEQDGTEFDNT